MTLGETKVNVELTTLVPESIALTGVLLAFVAAGWYRLKKRRLQAWTRIRGKVVAYREREVEDGVVFDPIVTFADTYGRETCIRPKEWWLQKRFEVGASVPVIFNPSNPARAFIDVWSSCYPEVVVLLVFSGFLIMGAGGMAIFFYLAE